MLGASGAWRMTAFSSTDTTETPIALVSGMCSWTYCASSPGSISEGAPAVKRVTIPHEAFLAVDSSKEAGIPVLAHKGDELIHGGNVWRGLVAVPLHVVPEPEDAPATHGAYVGSFGNRNLDVLAGRATECLPHFEYLHALTGDPERKVDLLSQMVRRAATLDEGTYLLAYSRGLELGERQR